MHILVLGGTHFLGRHVVDTLLDRGYDVTLFNRGQTDPNLFHGRVEKLVGDREVGLDPLQGRHFDACIDPSGYAPRMVGDSCRLLAEVVEHYTFVSSVSVYPSFVPNQDETAPLAQLEDPTTETVTAENYGGLKVLCEQIAEATLPGRVFNVRAGLLVGPFDPTDRFSYWPLRVQAGGQYVAPESPDLPVQVIDARDVALWIVHCLEQQTTGTFNVTGPQTTLGDVLSVCTEVTGSDAEPIWMAEDDLLTKGIRPWVDLPLWLPKKMRAMQQINTDLASAQGLTSRPLAQTVKDLVDWHPGGVNELQAGLTTTQEQRLLKHL